MSITKEKMLDVYATMKKIRMFEDRVAELFAEGKLPGFVHLYAGEEAIAVGMCSHGNSLLTGVKVRRLLPWECVLTCRTGTTLLRPTGATVTASPKGWI
jgi:hypothetical protein